MTSLAAEAWVAAVRALGGDSVAAEVAAAELERRYAEPHRRYHSLAHVDQVVRDASWLGTELGLDARGLAHVALAAAAHDVVYDARPGDDERASADWAAHRLAAAGVPAGSVRRVVDLVRTTVTHTSAPDDLEAGALLDADLAVLGAAPEAYARYVAAVRLEYAGGTGRRMAIRPVGAVLRGLLGRTPLYYSAPAAARWAAAAERNLRGELAGLETQQRPSPNR